MATPTDASVQAADGPAPGGDPSEAPHREPVVVLTEPELRTLVTLDRDALAAIEDAFTRLANGQADVPPIIGLFIPRRRGEVDVKASYIHGLPSLAVKIASGFFDNGLWGLPSGSGLMVVLSARTGYPQAVLLDNGYLTDVRTALAGAAAAKYLAPARVRTVGVIGAGAQGRYQVRALQLVRSFENVLVYDHSPSAQDAYVREMPEVLARDEAGLPPPPSGASAGLRKPCPTDALAGADRVRPVSVRPADPETLVRESDVVITCTPSHQPIVRAAWFHPGLHITAMGADVPEKQELESECLRRANVLACDLKVQCFARGEFRHALAAGVLPPGVAVTELGDLTSGRAPGREHEDDVSVCALTGVGVQDTAIALLAFGRAAAAHLGTEFPA
jgi:ornithine cyclodeaminase/alanine dehydrogenase-like protein (mu-crystallin family)